MSDLAGYWQRQHRLQRQPDGKDFDRCDLHCVNKTDRSLRNTGLAQAIWPLVWRTVKYTRKGCLDTASLHRPSSEDALLARVETSSRTQRVLGAE